MSNLNNVSELNSAVEVKSADLEVTVCGNVASVPVSDKDGKVTAYQFKCGYSFRDFVTANGISLDKGDEVYEKAKKLAFTALNAVKADKILSVRFAAKFSKKDRLFELHRTVKSRMAEKPSAELVQEAITKAEKKMMEQLSDMKSVAGRY